MRGRSLLAAIDSRPDGSGHATATERWQRALNRHAKVNRARTDVHHRQVLRAKTRLQGDNVLSQAETEAATSTDEWTWLAHMMVVTLLGLGGNNAPPTSIMHVETSVVTGERSEVASVQLTAPLVGYGVVRKESGSITARRVPVESFHSSDTGDGDMGTALNVSVGEDTQDAPAITSCAGFGYLHYTTPEQQPEPPMLYQPDGLTFFNWLLTPGVKPDGSPRRYCPQLDGEDNPENQQTLSASGELAVPYGRLGISAAAFDTAGDAAAASETPSGRSPRAQEARDAVESSRGGRSRHGRRCGDDDSECG